MESAIVVWDVDIFSWLFDRLSDSWVFNYSSCILSDDDGLISFIENLHHFGWGNWLDDFWGGSWGLNCSKEFTCISLEEFALFFESLLKICIALRESVLE